MARSTTSRARALHRIIPSPVLIRRILIPLQHAVRQATIVEKEKSCFPKFPVLVHLFCGIFFKIAQHRSLRELLVVATLKIQQGWLQGFHLKRSTVSDANNSKRRLKVIREVFANLVSQSKFLPRPLCKFARLAALDSTLLHCVPSASWASYRKKVKACKAHLLLDLASSIPKKILLSVGGMHDRKLFPPFLEKGWTYIVDRAYNDYNLFDSMNANHIFFVTRLKSDAAYEVRKKAKIKRNHRKKGILADLSILLGSGRNQMNNQLRLVISRSVPV